MMSAAATRLIGWLTLSWGLVLAADFAVTFFEVPQWLALFTEAQVAFFTGLPAWVYGLWGGSVAVTLLGGLGLIWQERWAVGSLLLAVLGFALFTLWLELLSDPPMQAVTGAPGVWLMTIVVGVTALLYMLARYARVDAQLS